MDLEHHRRGHLQCPLSEESVTGLPLLSYNFYLLFFILATERLLFRCRFTKGGVGKWVNLTLPLVLPLAVFLHS